MVEDDDVLPELQAYPLSMNTAQIADVLSLTPLRVRKLLEEGSLPGFRVGRQWRMRRAEVQRVMTGEWQPPDSSRS